MTDETADHRNLAIIGNEPEALFISVLFAEARISNFLVGLFEPRKTNHPRKGGLDEARWLLGIHSKSRAISLLGDVKDLPLADLKTLILVGHAHNAQDTSELERRVRALAKGLPRGSSLIFTGLCPPTFTSTTIRETIEKYSGMTVGKDLGLCYVPLLWSGEGLQSFKERPKLVAGVAREAIASAQETLLAIFPSLSSASSIEAAEAAGLFTPVYRDVIRALELELAGLCEGGGVDYAEVLDLCRSCGLNGLGLPSAVPARDSIGSTIALGAMNRKNRPQLVRAARRINEHAQHQILSMVKNALAHCGKRLRHSRIAILGLDGLGVKAELKPKLPEIFQTLRRRGAVVSFYPGEDGTWIQNGALEDNVKIEKSLVKAVEKAHCAIIALEKVGRGELNPQKLAAEMSRPAAICDLSRVLEASNVERAGLFYTSIGRGSPEA